MKKSVGLHGTERLTFLNRIFRFFFFAATNVYRFAIQLSAEMGS